jgi:hypothetical protein
MMARKKKVEIEMTKPLLREINDKSNGGFVLFSFNEEGIAVVNSNFESHQTAMALQHYINNWSKAIEAIALEATAENLTKDILGENDGQDPPPEEI